MGEPPQVGKPQADESLPPDVYLTSFHCERAASRHAHLVWKQLLRPPRSEFSEAVDDDLQRRRCGIFHGDSEHQNLLLKGDECEEIYFTDFDPRYCSLLTAETRNLPGVKNCLKVFMLALFMGFLKCRHAEWWENMYTHLHSLTPVPNSRSRPPAPSDATSHLYKLGQSPLDTFFSAAQYRSRCRTHGY